MTDLKSDPSLAAPALSEQPVPHGWGEDVHALLTAAGLIVLGLMLLKAAGLVTGGLAGLALFLFYLTGYPFGLLFPLINLPFVIFAFVAMGREFALKTIAMSAMIPLLSLAAPHVLRIDYVHPAVAAVLGGTLVGYGLLAAARHHASVGGVGIVALWLQRRNLAKAGYVQLGFDIAVLAVSMLRLDGAALFWSAISMVAMSGMLILWHKPGRYIGY